MSKIKNKMNRKINNNRSMLPGPEVIGDPFWCLMEWKNNKLTGNWYALNRGLCLFLEKRDAKVFKSKFIFSQQDR